MTKIRNHINNENGYIMAVVLLIFFLILTVLGLSAFKQVQSEGKLVGDLRESNQERFGTRSGADFAIRNFEAGLFQDGALPVTVGGVTLSAKITTPSSSEQSTYDANRLLTVYDGSDSLMNVYFFKCNAGYADKCIYTTGSSNISASGTSAPCATITGVTNVSPVDQTALYTLAGSGAGQGGIFTTDYMLSSSGPGTGFFMPSTTIPYVTWVSGNLTINSSITANGIWVVGGNVTMGSNSQIQGVLYMIRRGTQLTMNSGSSITGGVVGYGNINGTTITQNATFMTTFDAFAMSSSIVGVVNRTYITNP